MAPEPPRKDERGPGRTFTWLGGGAVAIACLVGVVRCAGDEKKGAAAPDAEGSPLGDGVQQASETRSESAATAALVPTSSNDVGTVSPSAASSPDAAGTAAPPNGGGSAIVQAVANSDSKDLALYSRIERELKKDPPPEVRALVRKRHAGATRDELVAGARALPDLSLRVLVLRWVDDVYPPPGGKAASPPVPGANPSPSSSNRPHVAPITKTSPQ